MCVVLLSSRSLTDGGLWSLTLEDYIHTNKLGAAHSANLKKLYDNVERLIICFSKQF